MEMSKFCCYLGILWGFLISFVTSLTLEMPKDYKMFETCDGKHINKKIGKQYGREKYTTVYPCLAKTAGETKWCLYQCGLYKLGYVDEDGKPDYEAVDKDIYAYKVYPKDKMDKFSKAIKECTEDKKLNRSNNCKSTREAYYCMHNKYIEICNKEDIKPLDVNQESGESERMDFDPLEQLADLDDIL